MIGGGQIKEGVKYILGRHRKYGGHTAVTKGLIEGLDKIGYVNYNYRPKVKNLFDNVHVLAGVKTLQYAIKLKREGKIKHLSAGPNIVVFSDDYNGIIASKEIDLFLTPSVWTANDYVRREPTLQDHIEAWPVGVDTAKFSPSKDMISRHTGRVLIYHKEESDQFCWHLDYYLRKKGYQTTIIKYGEYTLEQYIALLDKSEFMVVLSRQESQGIFMPEAWSMDVPTICYDRGYYRWKDLNREIEGDITSCPYIDKENGISFREMKEFVSILERWDQLKQQMSPRKWCIKNMSDKVCAERFVTILEERFS